MTWSVPMGEHRLAYAPGTFDGLRHIVTARIMTEEEKGACRDLARNPADLRGETDFNPHCTANVETRNESVFAARNVIDGLRFNTSHGEWPYESWGIGARTDAWCKIDLAARCWSAGQRLHCGPISPMTPTGPAVIWWIQAEMMWPLSLRKPESASGLSSPHIRFAGFVLNAWSKATIPLPSRLCVPLR